MNKFITTALVTIIFCIKSFAGEGMWMPNLLKLMNEKDMKDAGMTISADEIYSTNKSSIKDAICLFGAGCTAEVISTKGLILTNHHCGFDAVQQLSSIENDYLQHGFWAKNNTEEKPCAGLTVTFIKNIIDVTTEVLAGVSDSTIEKSREDIIKKNITIIETKNKEISKLGAQIKSFFGGNTYYLFIIETFKDIRLVGVPPASIGKFGADGDNWMWPRHTGDFSVFRIYANKENKAADFSTENVPYLPSYSLPINLSDTKENDFTMVYGFPARTTEYLPSDAIDLVRNISDPTKVNIRTSKLAVWDNAMRMNDTTRLQYAAKYASVANGWKKWQGEMKGIDRLDAINKRETQENNIVITEKKVANTNEAATLFLEIDKAYKSYKQLAKMRDLYNEAGLGIEIISFCNGLNNYFLKLNDSKLTDIEKQNETDKIKKSTKRFYKDYNPYVDAKVFDAIFSNLKDTVFKQELLHSITALFANQFPTANDIYRKSALAKKDKALLLMDSIQQKMNIIKDDIAFKLTMILVDYYNINISQQLTSTEQYINKLNRLYIKKTTLSVPNKKVYPDANSTLRVAFGNIKNYFPRDGVSYNWFTTYKGILEKEDATNDDYQVHPKLKELFKAKDFGRYADKNNDLRIAFIATNHTTGGNSGSPVLNAKGELIGTNFDRCWEGTMSDIIYDPEQCRNIILDIHYTLFVIDKFAGAGYLLNEMKIVN